MTERKENCLNCIDLIYKWKIEEKGVELPIDCANKIPITTYELEGKCEKYVPDPSFQLLSRIDSTVEDKMEEISQRIIEKRKIKWPPDWRVVG